MINKLPLPLAVGYTSKDHQNWKQTFRAGDYSTFNLVSPRDRLLPFQYRRPSVPDATIDIKLYSALTDGLLYNMNTFISAADISIQTRGITDYVTYFGHRAFSLAHQLDCGIYYIGVSDDYNDEVYSEIFTVLADADFPESYLAVSDDELLIFDDNQLIII
jgi:hypothetical protein